MRLPRVRFTVRRFMAVVAVLAVGLSVGLAGLRLQRRRHQFSVIATNYAKMEAIHRSRALRNVRRAEFEAKALAFFERSGSQSPFARMAGGDARTALAKAQETAIEATRMAERFNLLKRKYQTAASRPWRPVEPDPAMPGMVEPLSGVHTEMWPAPR